MANVYSPTIEKVIELSNEDSLALHEAEKSYADSWKKRGGVGAMMMLARKWDRIENQVQNDNYDVFTAISNDASSDGIIDDIRDLRRYLLLVEAEMVMRGTVNAERRRET